MAPAASRSGNGSSFVMRAVVADVPVRRIAEAERMVHDGDADRFAVHRAGVVAPVRRFAPGLPLVDAAVDVFDPASTRHIHRARDAHREDAALLSIAEMHV